MRALEEACARNAPVEVVRRELAGQVPLARGRMLELHDDELRVERVQVVGRAMAFRAGHELDAFFDFSGNVYQFRTSVTRVSELVQVNASLVVPAMTLARPTRVDLGQRRATFRVQVSARGDAPQVELWMLADSDVLGPQGQPPRMKPDFSGKAADVSALGLSVLIEGVTYTRFRHDMRALVHLHLQEQPEPLAFVGEVRQSRPVQQNSGARVGMVITQGVGDRREHQQRLRTLGDYVHKVQRDQLRSQDSGERKAS